MHNMNDNDKVQKMVDNLFYEDKFNTNSVTLLNLRDGLVYENFKIQNDGVFLLDDDDKILDRLTHDDIVMLKRTRTTVVTVEFAILD